MATTARDIDGDRGPRDWSVQPPYLHAAYKSTVARAPTKPLLPLPQTVSEMTGPLFGDDTVADIDSDLTRNAAKDGEAIGERIIVTGRVMDEAGRPVPRTLVEIWQANAAGRYAHLKDLHDAPLDPNFYGAGRCMTDDDGVYRFTSVRPGAYPWRNHENAWRPAHIHYSLFGPCLLTRLVTQMYFPGDPLLPLDPIYNSVPDEAARARLIADYAHDVSQPEWALGYRFDIVLRGPKATPREA